MLTAASTAVVEGPPAAVPIALRPGQNCFYCPRCELQEREGIQRGQQHRESQWGLAEPCQGEAADHSEVQHAATEGIWKEDVDCLILWTLFWILN